MNIFVLCSGRTGSVTFTNACSHISNYTAAHESRMQFLGTERFAYPARHIEADNRLSWFLGRLDQAYGDNAFYVHLVRNPDDVARSFVRRYRSGIMRAYADAILTSPSQAPIAVARDYCDTVNRNIELFLKDKSQTMRFQLEDAQTQFGEFWERISAEGDFEAACAEFKIQHNASGVTLPRRSRSAVSRVCAKSARLLCNLPTYIKYT